MKGKLTHLHLHLHLGKFNGGGLGRHTLHSLSHHLCAWDHESKSNAMFGCDKFKEKKKRVTIRAGLTRPNSMLRHYLLKLELV